ncbi:hypothetical protein L208DRAFT_1405403 [Tricholoma matsutake]|nr:hypothetical protein L208DRAFT_1405403 [Tricholoma matsutake 945]
MVSRVQYTKSHRRVRLAKLWAVYRLKACGLSARAFGAIHARLATSGPRMLPTHSPNSKYRKSERLFTKCFECFLPCFLYISYGTFNVGLV